MKLFIFTFLLFSLSLSLNAEILKPNPSYEPKDVISIQLLALKNNDIPYADAGIEQTWEFAHPNNKLYTGPLSNFTSMMNSKSYSIMLNHLEHKITFVKGDENISYFFVELFDNKNNKFGFQWTVSKVISDDQYNNCWMTIGVSTPMKLSNSA